MKYLLDTCVISECIKRQPDALVKNWFNQHAQESLFLSVITIAEIKKGIYKKRPVQPERALKLQQWLNTLEVDFSGRILSVDVVLEQWAIISAAMEGQGKTLAVMDSLIAATALHHGLVLVTRNVEDFEGLALEIVNPFVREFK